MLDLRRAEVVCHSHRLSTEVHRKPGRRHSTMSVMRHGSSAEEGEPWSGDDSSASGGVRGGTLWSREKMEGDSEGVYG